VDIRLLGTLDIRSGQGPVTVSGPRRRAVLGLLLLHANRPVTIRLLVDRVWGTDRPATAETALRNCVSAVRKTLRALPEVAVETVPLGYLLRVPPEATDVARFRRLGDEARVRLAAPDPAGALSLATEALDLWRGPALADLAGDADDWPELDILEQLRLRTVEDRIEAALMLGRHEQVVAELEDLVKEHPDRERLLGQHMLALYRCGRQAPALAAYQAARTVLCERFGREPGHELLDLRQAILEQRDELLPAFAEAVAPHRRAGDPEGGPGALGGGDSGSHPASVGAARMAGAVPAGATPSALWTSGGPVHRAELPPMARVPVAALGVPTPAGCAELRKVTLLSLRWSRGAGEDGAPHDGPGPRTAGEAFAPGIEEFGGRVEQVLGSTVVASFGALCRHADDATRAVLAALAVRSSVMGEGASPVARGRQGGLLAAAVASGEVLVRPGADGPRATLVGEVARDCARLLDAAPPGGIVVSPSAYRATQDCVDYQPAESALGEAWVPLGMRQPQVPDVAGRAPVPLLGRKPDLDLLRHLLDDTRRRRRPQLVTLLGPPGIGKTRLVEELARTAGPNVRCLTYRPGSVRGNGSVPSLAGLLDLLAEGRSDPGPDCPARACRQLLGAAAAGGPVLLVLEDLHSAAAELLDFVADLPDGLGPVPLLVVATSRPELLGRRPRWAGGHRDTLVRTLGPLPYECVRRLLAELVPEVRQQGGGRIRPELLRRVGGNPLFAVEYARSLSEAAPGAAGTRDNQDGPPPVPDAVEGVVAERLDLVPPDDRAVLRHAAVVGEVFWAGAVAALTGRSTDQVTDALRRLELRDLVLRVPGSRVPGEAQYSFHDTSTPEIAYGQLPRAVRADLHLRAAGWVERVLGRAGTDRAAEHRRQAAAFRGAKR
jgi:DNA-binding SARP family transcriptional activator/class 3 adenylate cyclase